MERTPREQPTHAGVDLTKPVKLKEVMAIDHSLYKESCFSHLWKPESKPCSICADNEMCGIMFHNRQKKAVKAAEAEMPQTLDTTDFEALNKTELTLWLKIKPRKFGEFVKHITAITKCADLETMKWWAKSFIVDNQKIKVVDNVITFLKN